MRTPTTLRRRAINEPRKPVVAAVYLGLARPWLAPLGLFVGALAFYAINLDRPPGFDELYHVLGARGYLEYGEPRIAEGVYMRVAAFTAVIAFLFNLFGESVVVARLPAVVCGALLTACLFAWTRAVAGAGAAWCAALLFLVSPFAVHIFQLTRFYAPQALLFWLGAVAVYAATADGVPARRAVPLALGAAFAFAAAFYLSLTTLIGLVGIGLWIVASFGLPWLARLERKVRLGALLAFAALGLALGGAAFALFGPELIHAYRSVPGLWAAERRNEFWFYHAWLNLYYPSLWPLFPFVALAALARWPRPALFCLAVFVPAMALHAFAAAKGLRLVIYAMPFLFALFGMALAVVAPRLAALGRDLTDRALQALGFAPQRRLRAAVIGAGLAFLVLANTASVRTASLLAGITVPPQIPAADWAGVAERLHPWLRDADVVLTGDELHTLYYLGRYDIAVGRSRMSELPDRTEFAPDPRTGRPVVSTAESVARIIDCFPAGLILTNRARWRHDAHLDADLANAIVARTEPLDLPPRARIMAFVWRHATPSDPAACDGLPALPDRAGG